jgi:hypothetical protein
LFEWEKELVGHLLIRLEGTVMGVGADSWVWKPDREGGFSVNSCYKLLLNLFYGEVPLNEVEKVIFREIWRSKAPAKVLAFSWTMLLDRIPTKINLAKRRIVGVEDSKRCVFCEDGDESVTHLFLHCVWVSRVWREVMRWLDFTFITPPNLFIHAICWTRGVGTKKLRKAGWLIWHAVVWGVWKARNDRIFNDKSVEVVELVDHIKVLSWQWSLAILYMEPCLFYKWCWNPRFCLRG